MTKYYFIITCILYGLYGYYPLDNIQAPWKNIPGWELENSKMDSTTTGFLHLKAQSTELLITEIMFDPPLLCPEYLEITNMSQSVTYWENLWLQKVSGPPLRLNVPTTWPLGESRIITSDKEQFLACYNEVNDDLVYEVDLFALSNKGTTIVLIAEDPVEREIDKISYTPSDHNNLFSNTRGVALERNLDEPESNKWRSGFVQFGYRSPGFLPDWEWNSSINVLFSTPVIYSLGGRSPSELEIKIESGNVDGNITIEIFDLNGRQVQTLANGVPIQGGELFIWKGRTKSGSLLPEGLYLFWIYYFDTKGRKRIFRKTCVLSNN